MRMTESPAAWHPDPYARHEVRYWDGSRWTEHVADAGIQTVEIAEPPKRIAPRVTTPAPKRATFTHKPLKFSGIQVRDGRLIAKDGTGGPIVGMMATVDTAGALERRITATRILTTGVFALAWRKKKDSRELYLLIEGKGWAVAEQVNPKKGAEARKFAAALTTLGARASRHHET